MNEIESTRDYFSIRTPLVAFHVLRDDRGLYLIDTGFAGGFRLLRNALRRKKWDHLPLRGILLTHGHLDHSLNAAPISRASKAWIAAPRLDADYFAGRPHYSGLSRVAGVLEGLGRPLLGFQPFTPDQWIDDGAFFDVWHGLRAIHLPGHTPGHTAFYCERLKLLFSADLFASYRHASHLAPAIFNSQPGLIPASLSKALAFPMEGLIPNHGDCAEPMEHLRRFRALWGAV